MGIQAIAFQMADVADQVGRGEGMIGLQQGAQLLRAEAASPSQAVEALPPRGILIEANRHNILQQPFVRAQQVGPRGLHQRRHLPPFIELVDLDVLRHQAEAHRADADQAGFAARPMLAIPLRDLGERPRPQFRRLKFQRGNRQLLQQKDREDDAADQHPQGPHQPRGADAAGAHSDDFRLIGQGAKANDRAQQAGDRQQFDADARQAGGDHPQRIQGAEGAAAGILQLLRQLDEAEQPQEPQQHRRSAPQQRGEDIAIQQIHEWPRREAARPAATSMPSPRGAHQRCARTPCSTPVRAMPMKL